MTDHPITPPPELVQQLCDSAALSRSFKNISIREVDVLLILEAFQAGADQELEACCTWLSDHGYIAADPELRAARRSKALSLKELALKALEPIERYASAPVTTNKESLALIRKALEALPND
jgi:hypothetical protein